MGNFEFEVFNNFVNCYILLNNLLMMASTLCRISFSPQPFRECFENSIFSSIFREKPLWILFQTLNIYHIFLRSPSSYFSIIFWQIALIFNIIIFAVLLIWQDIGLLCIALLIIRWEIKVSIILIPLIIYLLI